MSNPFSEFSSLGSTPVLPRLSWEPQDADSISLSRTPSTNKGTGTSTPATTEDFSDVRYHVMCSHIHRSQCIEGWIRSDAGANEGTILKQTNGVFAAMPNQFCESDMALAITALDVPVSRSCGNVASSRTNGV